MFDTRFSYAFYRTGFVFFFSLVTKYEFEKQQLSYCFLGLINRGIPYSEIKYCDKWIARNSYRIGTLSKVEAKQSVFLRQDNENMIAILRVKDIDKFVSLLTQHAPHVSIRAYPVRNRSVSIGQ